MSRLPIRRALVSVSDKSGLDELGAALKQAGVAVVSTGSTAKVLAAAGAEVKAFEQDLRARLGQGAVPSG